MADLRLDIREGAFAERKNGFVILPGKPADSLIIKRITSDDPGFRMPPPMSHKTLTAEQKDILRRWLKPERRGKSTGRSLRRYRRRFHRWM